MKEIFVVGGLDTSEKKQEAEALLKQLGYKDDKLWNEEYRDGNDSTFISTQRSGGYGYHTHACDPRTLITLTQLKSKAMKTDNLDQATWTRKQFKSLHSIACSDWQEKLIKMFPSFATEDECEITKREYNSMMSACTTKQKELMNSIFGAEPFKKKVMFMCTKDFGFDFSKGKEYEFVSVTSDGYKLINEHNDVHTISVGKWADYFYRID